LVLEENGVTYKVKARIWDTAGQERYKAVTGVQMRNAHGALVVYDITNKNSFDKVTSILDELPDLTGTDTKVFLVGNKLDLVEENPHDRQVQIDEMAQIGNKHSIYYEEVSALASPLENINNIFEKLVRDILKNMSEDNNNGNIVLNRQDSTDEKKEESGCSC